MLQGLGKLSNSLINFYLSGEIVKDSRLYHVRVFGGPPRSGTLTYEIFALMQTGELPLYAQVLTDLAKHFIPEILKAVVARVVGRHGEMIAVIDKITDLANKHAQFAESVHEGHMRDKEWLQNHITMIATQNRAPLRELVKPIGSSVRRIKFGNEAVTDPAVIEEAEAEVLSSKEDLEVGEMTRYRAVFYGVDTTNGTSKVQINDEGEVLRGKITDPALANPRNVYTHSLDTKEPVSIIAKPVMKDGRIVQLFISDGNFITDVAA